MTLLEIYQSLPIISYGQWGDLYASVFLDDEHSVKPSVCSYQMKFHNYRYYIFFDQIWRIVSLDNLLIDPTFLTNHPNTIPIQNTIP